MVVLSLGNVKGRKMAPSPPLVGYDRYATKAAFAALREVHRLLELHVSFLQPPEAPREGPQREPRPARVRSGADAVPAGRGERRAQARTVRGPRGALPAARPRQLRHQLAAALEHLWTLATPSPRAKRPVQEQVP